MKEYIERANVIPALKDYYEPIDPDLPMTLTLEQIAEVIGNIPAADVVEVRHGRWIGLEYDGYADGDPVYDLWECSECGEEVRGEDVPVTHPWCHCCGARMGKEADHEVS